MSNAYSVGDHVEILYGKPDERRWVAGAVSGTYEDGIDVEIDGSSVYVRAHELGRVRVVAKSAGDA